MRKHINDVKKWDKEYNTPSDYILKTKTIQYIDNKDWYKNSSDYIKGLFGENSELFISLLSATSPRNSVKSNVKYALHAYYSILNHRPIRKKYGIANKNIQENIKRIVNGEPIHGVKINAFSDALNGNLNSIVIDSWMLKAFNIKRQAPTPRDIRNISHRIRRISGQMGLKPSEVQACLWSWVKTEHNDTKFKESYDFSKYLCDWNRQILKGLKP